LADGGGGRGKCLGDYVQGEAVVAAVEVQRGAVKGETKPVTCSRARHDSPTGGACGITAVDLTGRIVHRHVGIHFTREDYVTQAHFKTRTDVS